MNFKKDFWEKKIIGWENGRYAFEKTNLSTLENVSSILIFFLSASEYSQAGPFPPAS